MIDQSGGDQRGDRGEYNVAIGIREPEERYEIAGKGIGNTRHSADELHDHDPSCPECQSISRKRASPLIGVTRERNLTGKLRENHRHQKLPASDDEPTPDESRATRAETVSVIGEQT